MTKTCLACGERLSGRIDKKFCNTACRNDFHNRRLPVNNSIEKKVSANLRQNRAILRDLISKGICEIPVCEIEFYGFNFNGINGFEESEQGKFIMNCYEFIIIKKGGSLKINQVF
jgi:hypothetical protein